MEDGPYDLSDRDDDSEEQRIANYNALNEGVTGRSLSKNEVQFLDDLKKILADENLYYENKNTGESLYEIVMKMFTLYVEGVCGADELFSILEDVFRHIDEFEQFKSF